MKHLSLLALGFVGLTCSVYANNVPVYGKRYCEIVYSKNYMDFNVYSSNNAHSCPHSWWKGVNESGIKKDTNAQYVFLNGPRVWVVDDMVDNQPGKMPVSHFKGKPLHLVGTFHADFQSLLRSHGPYTDYKINRNQSFSIRKGREVVELINPKGQVYLLQSLSLKKRSQNPAQISQLKQHLALPKGWTFKTGQLSSDYRLAPSANAIHIVQDEHDNTYQLISKDLLK
jgi:hypothetical protein